MVYIKYCIFLCVFFFKQKTAYEMRISDWSSDVCSSDLAMSDTAEHVENEEHDGHREQRDHHEAPRSRGDEVGRWGRRRRRRRGRGGDDGVEQIGRASCRESVCQYV